MTDHADEKTSMPAADARPVSVRLNLFSFKLIDTFHGYYYYGSRDYDVEPAHALLIHATWRYDPGSDKLSLKGEDIEPTMSFGGSKIIQLTAASTREDADRGHGHHEHLSIRIPENLFAPLVSAIRHDDLESAVIIFEAEPHPRDSEVLKISFGNIEIVHRKIELYKESPSDPYSDILRRFQRLQFIIIVLLVLIALAVWR